MVQTLVDEQSVTFFWTHFCPYRWPEMLWGLLTIQTPTYQCNQANNTDVEANVFELRHQRRWVHKRDR